MSNTPCYHLEFPHSSFAMHQFGTFAVSPACDRSVTDASITVFRAWDTAVGPRCTDHVGLRCTASANRRSTQSVPRWKPSRFLGRFTQDVPDWPTPGTPLGFIQSVPKVLPHGTPPGTSRPELDVRYRLRVTDNILVGVGVVVHVWVGESVAFRLCRCNLS